MVLIWALNFIIGKVALDHIEPLTLASFRVVLAAILLTPIYALRAGRQKFSRHDLGTFAWLGLLGVAGNQMLFTVGLNYTTAGHSSLVIATGPIAILLLASLRGLESLTTKKVSGMALCFAGVTLLALEHGLKLQGGTLAGDLITLTGTMAFAVYAVLAKKVASQYDTIAMNFFNFAFGALMVLPIAVWRGRELDWAAVPWQGWAGLVYMSLFASVVAYLIYYWGLKYLAASRMAAFSYFLPVIAVWLGILLRGEPATMQLFGGGALILVGVYLTELHTSPADEDDELPDPAARHDLAD